MIKNQVQSYLQDKLKTKVIIGSVDYRLPEWIEINNVYIEDKQKDTLIFYLAEKLTENWYKELAGATGFGLRFDANILVIRADLGIPLRKPYLPDGQRWVFSQINFGSGSWRRENLILNIALGLPF